MRVPKPPWDNVLASRQPESVFLEPIMEIGFCGAVALRDKPLGRALC